MKTSNASPLTALILKSVGIVLIVLYLLDCAVVLSSSRFQDSQWLFTTTTQLIDRGFVPMMGFGFLFIGFWVESALEPTLAGERSRGLKLGAALLSSLLALLFLLFIPLIVNATNAAADDQMKQITQDASRAESQIDGQVQQLRAQIDAQSGQIDQLIQSGQLQGTQLAQAKQKLAELQKFKSDPKALEAQIAPERDQKLTQIRDNKRKLETQINDNKLRSGMRSGIASLVLALGYAVIGWTGLRYLLSAQNQRSQLP